MLRGRPGRPVKMTRVTEPSDEDLLLRMLGGEEDAFVVLYRRRHPAIYRFSLHMSGNASVAEDVTQEVFMALIRDARRFDPTRGTLGGFLFGIARNHLRKRWEQDQRLVPMGDEDAQVQRSVPTNGNGSSWHGERLIAQEATQHLRRAIATLPENYREVVVLCELEEMSYEDAAVALDCPIGTVRSRLHRARALLCEKLREARTVRRVSAAGE